MKTNQEGWEKEFEEQFRYEEYHNGWVSTGKMVSSKAVKDFIAKVREQAIRDTLERVEKLLPYGVSFTDEFYKLKNELLGGKKMRAIKFRAWNKLDKEMENIESINWRESLVEFMDEFGRPDGDLSMHDVILMQYTGLKDKNGKEIYEGDILHNQADKFDYEIVWDGAEAAWSLGDNGTNLNKYQLSIFWEVIGNVWETPELLNSKTK